MNYKEMTEALDKIARAVGKGVTIHDDSPADVNEAEAARNTVIDFRQELYDRMKTLEGKKGAEVEVETTELFRAMVSLDGLDRELARPVFKYQTEDIANLAIWIEDQREKLAA